jgi:polar amino acid transport system substrate-binding protein
MVQKGSDLTNADQITSDMGIAVQQGTTGQEYAETKTDGQVQSFAEIGTAFNALQAGQVDAVINDFAVSAFALKKYPELDVVQTIPTGEHYGFPMQKTNTALIDAVNGALKDNIDNGTYETIFKGRPHRRRTSRRAEESQTRAGGGAPGWRPSAI